MVEKTQGAGWANAAGAIAGLTGAFAAALIAIKFAATYLPPHRIWLWWVPAAFVGIGLALSSYFWIFDHSWRRKWEATQAQVNQLAVNEGRGIRAIAYLSPKDDRNIGKETADPANVVSVGPLFEADGLKYQSVYLTAPNGQQTEFGYAVLYDSASWEKDSSTHFVGSDGKPVHVETLLANANIQELAERAARVMCFGFASSERKSNAAENEALSDDRAINLCEALIRLGYVSGKRGQEAVAVGFGEATTDKDVTTDPARERPAVIIGIVSSPQKPRAATFLAAVRHATKDAGFNGVELSNYSRFKTKIKSFRMTTADGLYTGYRDASKWPNTAQIYSEIEPIEPIALQPTGPP